VDLDVADDVVAVIMASVDGPQDVTIDLSDLTFLDSTGLRALIQISQSLGPDGKLILESPRGTVARLLEIVGADDFPGVEIRDAPD
jgi:anti-anti-sigma factor